MTLLKYSPLLHHCSMSLSKKRENQSARISFLSGARLRGERHEATKEYKHTRTHTHTPVSKLNKQNNKRLQKQLRGKENKANRKKNLNQETAKKKKKDEKCNEIFSFFLSLRSNIK